MFLRGIFFFLLYSFVSLAQAVEIAFFIRTKPDGTLEVYEEGTLFSHVAIRVDDHWLEARPWYGVHLTQDTSDMGVIAKIYRDDNVAQPDASFLESVLGKDYFLFADWYDPDVWNCTKLIASYLNIAPKPMNFDPMLWGDRFHEYLGKPGLSLLELELELQERDYVSHAVSGCGAKLKK